MDQTIQLPPPLLKVPEVAGILNCSKAYIYQLIKRKEIPSVQIGSAVRIRQEDLEHYIAENLQGLDV